MKKTFIAILMLISIIALQHREQISKAYAQEVGVGEVIFEQNIQAATSKSFLINELSYTIIKLHIIIAGRSIDTNSYQSEKLSTIKKLEELTKTDIINVLDVSADKEKALAQYLNDSEQNLQKGETIVAYMKQEMNMLIGDMNSCITEKGISDKAYFDAIERYDQNIMESSLGDSINNEKCISENRIQYNAESEIADKLVFYLGALQQKYDVISAKQDILANNFTVFRDNILPDLNQIDQLLQQYKF